MPCPFLSVKSHLTSGASVSPENTQQAIKIKIFVGLSLKLLHCIATVLPAFIVRLPCSKPFSHYRIHACTCNTHMLLKALGRGLGMSLTSSVSFVTVMFMPIFDDPSVFAISSHGILALR